MSNIAKLIMQRKDALSILVIPDTLPYPPDDGGKLCVFGLIDYLRKIHHIQIILSAYNQNEKNVIQSLREVWPDVTVHCVELFEQELAAIKPTKSESIKKSLKGIFNLFFGVTKEHVASVNNSIYDDVYKTTPFFPHHKLFVKKIADVLAGTSFDIIQTELTRMLNLIHLFPDTAKKVFVQIEGRADVLYDYGISHHEDLNYVKYIADNTAFLEYRYMSRYDAILALNKTDENKISEKLPSSVKVYTSPYGILSKDIKEPDLDNYKIENLIFVGGENHYPNVDALNWFLTEVILKFKNRPFRKLYITGNWSQPTIARYKQLSGAVDFIGFVNDLTPYLNNSVSIVPIRIGGGGIRTKILSAMANGSPVVSTSLAAVGIKAVNQKQLLIADTAEGFADAINTFFIDEEFTLTAIRGAYELITKEYSQSVVGEIRNKIYYDICNMN